MSRASAALLVVGLLSSAGCRSRSPSSLVVGLGTLIGIVNGIIVSKIGVNAFIATLGTGTIVVGLNYAYSGGIPLQLTQSREFTDIAIGRIAGRAASRHHHGRRAHASSG